MTKEQFDALDDTWQTVYLDGYTPIRMVSKYSSKKDHILWYDIAVHTVSDFTPMMGVRYMFYDEIINRCRLYYEKDCV